MMEPSLTRASFGQTGEELTCSNCYSRSCRLPMDWIGCCCSALRLTDRCCWSLVQPTSKTKRTEPGYWRVADPNSAAVLTLDSATGSAWQLETAVGRGRSSGLFESGMRFLEQTRIQRSSRVPFRADRDSSSFNSSC